MIKLTRIIAISLIAVSIMALNPIGASAEWRKGKYNWWYYTEGNSYAKGWRYINVNWYYFESDGRMTTGWSKIGHKTYYFDKNGHMQTGWMQGNNEKWYYLYSNGERAENTVVDGYELDFDGAWIKPSKEAEEARNLILKEDGNYISLDGAKYNCKLERSYREGNITKFLDRTKLQLPQEDVYEFWFTDPDILDCVYLVGKVSKNVYCISSQGLYSAYQIKNNQKVKTYKWIGDYADNHDWR